MGKFSAVTAILWILAMSAGQAHAEWQSVTSKESAFAARFPTQPQVETTTEKATVDGKTRPLTHHMYTSKDDKGTLCLVLHSVYTWPINIEAELIADRDNFVKEVSATVKQSKRLTVARGAQADIPALAFDAVAATYIFRSLIAIDGEDVYMVGAGIPVKGGETADLATCVNGFRLTERK